ncbi:hypothetical protein MKX08_009083 [Trichoderma sp. CBMAI-0020]|nr:hypothetical protein MKX08_009083 [Trichoderma sp. CBMAI-0020]
MKATAPTEPVQEDGFTIVYDTPQAKADVVFIHGVLGKQPWTSDNGVFWPQILLAPKLPDTRILSYNYTEKISFSEGKTDASVAEIVYGRLFAELADCRTQTKSPDC